MALLYPLIPGQDTGDQIGEVRGFIQIGEVRGSTKIGEVRGVIQIGEQRSEVLPK